MADKGSLSVEQRTKTVLFFNETRSVVVTHRRFRAHFQMRWEPVVLLPSQQVINRGSVGPISHVNHGNLNSIAKERAFQNNSTGYVFTSRSYEQVEAYLKH
jgi:hypothetical protein